MTASKDGVRRPAAKAAGWPLLALLIAISAVGPLPVNIILPAIPGLARALAADPRTVQLTVSLYFAGLASAQLLLGPLSDRFGRRPILLGGFVVAVLTSLAAAQAMSIGFLIRHLKKRAWARTIAKSSVLQGAHCDDIIWHE